MAKQILNSNQTWSVVVNNGTARTLLLGSDGTLSVPANLKVLIGGFNGIFTHSNSADRTYTLPNRTGNVALEDATSLNNMLPSQSGHTNQFLQTDGAGTLSWATSAVTAITSINGNTTAGQTLTYSNSGTAPAWSTPTGSTVQLAIPMASAGSVTAGLLSNTDYGNIPFKNQINTFSAVQTFTNAPSITNPGTGNNDVATYGQVLAARNGIGIRPPVAAIDAASTTLGTNNPVIDGYTIAIGDRVLATALTTNPNRVYKATGTLSAITWTLEIDGQAGDGTPTDGDILFVRNGTVHADQQYAYNGSAWVLYNISAAYTFSAPLSISGTTVSLGTVGIGNGGTGQTSQTAAFDALSPNTTAGDFSYRGASNNVRLAGNSTATKMFLNMTSSVPGWSALVSADIPNLDASKITTGTLTTSRGGTGESVSLVKYIPVSSRLFVRAVATANINIASPGTSIDGYSMTASDRILLTAQTTPSQNGIWIWAASGSALTRPEDYAAGSTTQAYLDTNVLVTHGTSFAGSEWRITTTGAITIDTTSTAWSQISFNIGTGSTSGVLPIGSGGTGQTSATAAFNALMPLTTLGDTLYASGVNTAARLAGNTTTTKQYLSQTGNGSVSAAPVWAQINYSDLAGSHVLDSAVHTISGKTAGQVLLATTATTFAFTTISQDLAISGSGVATVSKINNVAVNDLALQNNTATLADNTAAATLVTGASYANATYRSARLWYQLSRGAGNYSVGSIILLYDGTNARITQIEDDSIGTLGVTFTADINTGNMRLLYTTTSTGTAVTMYYRVETFLL